MLDAGKAGSVAIIAAFVLFIFWAKTEWGRRYLAEILGDPKPAKRTKKRSAPGQTASRTSARTRSPRNNTSASKSKPATKRNAK